jgi:tetratricopeptide (TPR) repeat protein
VEASPQLFATMCALDAAGFDSQSAAPSGHPELAALLAELREMRGPATEALRAFYHEHELGESRETLSRYISFALVVGPPPKFTYSMERLERPPDVLALEGFEDVLAAFFKEAQIDRRWDRLQPQYVQQARQFDGPLRKIVTVASAYLREIVKRTPGRSFTVYVEPLVGNRTNFRDYSEHYALVVGTGPAESSNEIRHAFLHFLLNPLPLRYRRVVEGKKELLGYAARAPRLPEIYRQDFVALFTECLVKAVELRLDRLPASQLEASLADDDRSGLILVRPLRRQLESFEKAEPAMSFYFPELLRGIDVAAEKQRLGKVEFATADSTDVAPEAGAHPHEVSELDVWLSEGDRQIALQNAPAAAATFERVLAKYPNVPRAVYGLAVASVLQGEAAKAQELFERIVTPPAEPAVQGTGGVATDPGILAWSHIYLGRIHDIEGERNLAVAEYRAARGVPGAPEAALAAAQRGIDTGYKPSAKGHGPEPQHP